MARSARCCSRSSRARASTSWRGSSVGSRRTEPLSAPTTPGRVARVGLIEHEARRDHGRIVVLRHDFAHVDRAAAEARTEGFVKLVVTPWRGKTLEGVDTGLTLKDQGRRVALKGQDARLRRCAF